MSEASVDGAGVSPSRTAHSERVLASLLLPAAAIIRTKGILGASVDDLVDAVGVSKGTLYYHIRTKDGLLYWIHESVTKESYDRWTTAIEETAAQPATETFRRMVLEHCTIVHEYRDCVAVISEEMKYLPRSMQQDIKARRLAYQRLLEGVLERGVREGDFALESAEEAASVIISTLNAMYRWYSPEGSLSYAEIADTATDFLLHGLRTAP